MVSLYCVLCVQKCMYKQRQQAKVKLNEDQGPKVDMRTQGLSHILQTDIENIMK